MGLGADSDWTENEDARYQSLHINISSDSLLSAGGWAEVVTTETLRSKSYLRLLVWI